MANADLKKQNWKPVKGYLEKEMATCFCIVPGESHGQRILAGCSPWGCKSWTWLRNYTTNTTTTTRRIVGLSKYQANYRPECLKASDLTWATNLTTTKILQLYSLLMKTGFVFLFLHFGYVCNEWKTNLLRVSFHMGRTLLTDNSHWDNSSGYETWDSQTRLSLVVK